MLKRFFYIFCENTIRHSSALQFKSYPFWKLVYLVFINITNFIIAIEAKPKIITYQLIQLDEMTKTIYNWIYKEHHHSKTGKWFLIRCFNYYLKGW